MKMKKSRNTTAKTEILNIISNRSVALSHAEIQAILDGLCDRVTIYRVLDRLIEDGEIHKVINIDGITKYASCNTCITSHNHQHIHFNCEKCNTVTCLEDIEPTFNLPKEYKINDVNFTVSGVCPECVV